MRVAKQIPIDDPPNHRTPRATPHVNSVRSAFLLSFAFLHCLRKLIFRRKSPDFCVPRDSCVPIKQVFRKNQTRKNRGLLPFSYFRRETQPKATYSATAHPRVHHEMSRASPPSPAAKPRLRFQTTYSVVNYRPCAEQCEHEFWPLVDWPKERACASALSCFSTATANHCTDNPAEQ